MKNVFILFFSCIQIFLYSQEKLPIGGVINIHFSINQHKMDSFNIAFQYIDYHSGYEINCINEGDLLYINDGEQCYSFKITKINYYYGSFINANVISLKNSNAHPIGIGILIRSDDVKTLILADLPHIIDSEIICFLEDYLNINLYK